MPDTYVTTQELEVRRSAADYVSWWNAKATEIGQTEPGKRAYRERQGLMKKFVTEALPIAIVCDRFFHRSDAVYVTHLVGDQNHDARIEDDREAPSGLDFLEITHASENFDSKHRMIYLNENGSVSLTGELSVRRRLGGGIPVVNVRESVAVEHGAACQAVLNSIHEVASKKGKKNYPKNTGLVVVFDPGPGFRSTDDLELLDEFTRKNVMPEVSNFKTIIISGGDGGVFMSYPVP